MANLIELFPIKFDRHICESWNIMSPVLAAITCSCPGILFLVVNLVLPAYLCAMLTE